MSLNKGFDCRATQQTVTDDGEDVLVDEHWNSWTESQLIPEGTEPDPEARPVEAYSTFTGIFAWGWREGARAATRAIRKTGIAGYHAKQVANMPPPMTEREALEILQGLALEELGRLQWMIEEGDLEKGLADLLDRATGVVQDMIEARRDLEPEGGV